MRLMHALTVKANQAACFLQSLTAETDLSVHLLAVDSIERYLPGQYSLLEQTNSEAANPTVERQIQGLMRQSKSFTFLNNCFSLFQFVCLVQSKHQNSVF
jgi:hypothetical protein